MVSESDAATARTSNTHHANDFRVDRFCDDTTLLSNVLEHLVQSLRLDLLAPQLERRIVEVEDDAALL